MMTNFDNVIVRIKKQFAGIHVDIQKHDVIGGEYEISCYGINDNRSRELVSFVFALNDELYPSYDIEFIPILYNLTETSEHFPQIALNLMLETIPISKTPCFGLPADYSVPFEFPAPNFQYELNVDETNTPVQAEWKKPAQSEPVEMTYGVAA
jgi:hypothetical protein